MGLVELGGIAALGFAVGLYPGVYHLLTSKKERTEQGSVRGVELLAGYISRAQSVMDFVTGEVNPLVWNPLEHLISHQLEMNPALKMRMLASDHIFGLRSNPSGELENRLYELAKCRCFGDQLQMKLSEHPGQPHFGLIDGLHLYVEEPHAPQKATRIVTIYENSAFMARRFQKRFERDWNSVEEIPLEQASVIAHPSETKDPEEVKQLIRDAESLPIFQALRTP